MSEKDIFRHLRVAVADNPVATAYINTVAEQIAEREAQLNKRVYGHNMMGIASRNDDWNEFRRAEKELFHRVAEALLAIPGKIAPAPAAPTAEETVDELYSLLVELADHTPCFINSHGHCVEHSWIESRRCPHARAQELLKERKA